MKSALATLLLGSCSFCLVAFAQKDIQKQIRPDLSGTWVMQKHDQKKDVLEVSELTLVITHREPEVRITRKFMLDGKQQEQKLFYYTDRRGEDNVTLRGGKIKSKSWSKWEKDRLVTRYSSYSARIAGPPITADIEVEWELLEGGNVLIEKITNSYRSSAGRADAGVSARDLRASPVLPPSVVFRRVYVLRSTTVVSKSLDQTLSSAAHQFSSLAQNWTLWRAL